MSSSYRADHLDTQNDLLLHNLTDFFQSEPSRLAQMLTVINGKSRISLRILDWFVTNFAKKNYVWYNTTEEDRFKVHTDYKLKLKAYKKKNFDVFARWERTMIPYDEDHFVETTIGQLNFFKWAIENHILDYIQSHYDEIEQDMVERNTTSRARRAEAGGQQHDVKTRKKREELSESACKCIKKETIKIIVKFT